jgi:hypothetical protein
MSYNVNDRKKSNGLTISNFLSLSLSLSLKPSCSTVTIPYKHIIVQSASHSVHMNGGFATFNLWWTKWHQTRFFSKHSSFLLTPSLNQCFKHIHSSNSGAILPQQLSAFLNTTPPSHGKNHI